MHRRLAVGLTLALLAACSAAPDSTARLLGRFPWNMERPWFGGWSAIELGPDGQEVVLLNDRGRLLRGRIRRDGDRITGVDAGKPVRLRASTGAWLGGRIHDSEGLALLPDGGVAISFEGVHRLALYHPDTAPALPLPRAAAFRDLPLNGGLEALAIAPDGRLYAIPEQVTDNRDRIPVYCWDGVDWQIPFTLPASGSFHPVGADFGPDGRLYLLERAIGFIGFKTRLRRWTLGPDGPSGEETLLTTRPGTHDNLEGLAIWRDASGRLRATMISDDNFAFFQTTEIVEYLLPD